MSSLSNSEVTMVTSEGSVLASQAEKSLENKNDTEQTSLTSLKTPVVIIDNGKQNIHSNSSRLLFQFNQNNISNIYALAQANLVQQTQQDIMKMFSAEYSDHFTVKEVESSSPKEKCVVIKKDHESKAKEEQLICNVKGCGRSFASLGHMRNHQLMHEKEKALECHYKGCGRKFSWPAHLKYHLLTHENTKTFKCFVENCDKSFVTGQQLKVHSRTHTGERPFKCDQCLKAFSTAGNLKNHVRTHTGDKPYECTEPKCHLRFAEYSSLKKHLLKHTGEKPFKCPVCSRSFTQSGSMRVHMKKHTQQDTSVEREPEYNVVMMEDNSTSNNIVFCYKDSQIIREIINRNMSQYQSLQASLQDYLTSLPEGLHLTQHAMTTSSGHFFVLQFANEPVLHNSKPVHIKQEQEPMETNTDVKPVFSEQEVDMKPASMKREIITPVSPTTELENPETTVSYVSVFSRLGPKLQCDYTSSSTDKRRNCRFRRLNQKNRKNIHSSQYVEEDLRTYLQTKHQSAPRDLRQLISRRIPAIDETAHECFHKLISGSYYR